MDRTPQQVSDRVDALIKEIKGVMEGTAATWPGGKTVPHVVQEPRDVVCIAHGHILATFALRWLGRTLDQGTRILFEPAGVAILGYVFTPCPRDLGLDQSAGEVVVC
jgi:broad specificity phosphatase PhoE